MCQAVPELDRFFRDAGTLPAMPEVARRLIACFGNESVTLPELVALIEQDPALAARLLRLGNSARFAGLRRVTRLRDAAGRIGLDALRGLALGASLAGVFPHPPGFDRLRFWCQNLATAGYARALAGLKQADVDTAEIAGLMLRAGELLMLRAEPGLVALVEALAGPPDSVFEVERVNFGLTHAELSAELAVRWRFPTEVVDALATAGDPLAAQPFSTLGALVRCASVLADAAADGTEPVAALFAHQPALVTRLDLSPDAVREVLPNWLGLCGSVGELLD